MSGNRDRMNGQNTHVAQWDRRRIRPVCSLISGNLLCGLVHMERHPAVRIGMRIQEDSDGGNRAGMGDLHLGAPQPFGDNVRQRKWQLQSTVVDDQLKGKTSSALCTLLTGRLTLPWSCPSSRRATVSM